MRLFYLWYCFLFFKLSIIGQNEGSMANVWTENWLSGSFNLTIDSNWKITLEEQFRLKFINDTYYRNKRLHW